MNQQEQDRNNALATLRSVGWLAEGDFPPPNPVLSLCVFAQTTHDRLKDFRKRLDLTYDLAGILGTLGNTNWDDFGAERLNIAKDSLRYIADGKEP